MFRSGVLRVAAARCQRAVAPTSQRARSRGWCEAITGFSGSARVTEVARRGITTVSAGFWGQGTRTVTAVDCHAGGEPARVIIAGAPHVSGDTMLEKRGSMILHHDEFRQTLLQEPRGYPCQNANVVFPSIAPGCDYGYVILEQNTIYPLMSGHNTICVATALLETGMVRMVEPVSRPPCSLPPSRLHTSHAPRLCAPFRHSRCRSVYRSGRVEDCQCVDSPASCNLLLVVVLSFGVGHCGMLLLFIPFFSFCRRSQSL